MRFFCFVENLLMREMPILFKK